MVHSSGANYKKKGNGKGRERKGKEGERKRKKKKKKRGDLSLLKTENIATRQYSLMLYNTVQDSSSTLRRPG
jgi:hypothetical protein